MSELQFPTVKDVATATKEAAKCLLGLFAVGGLVLAHLFFMGEMMSAVTDQGALVDKSTYTNDPNMLCMDENMYLHPCVALDDVLQDVGGHLRASMDDAKKGAALRECLVQFYFHGQTLDCLSLAFNSVGVASKDILYRDQYLHGDLSLQVVRNGTQWTYQYRSDTPRNWQLASTFLRINAMTRTLDQLFNTLNNILW